MRYPECLSINGQGHLAIGGVDTVEMAKEYGTPLYLLDEELIVKNCRSYLESMKRYYNGFGMVVYASKAMCCKEIYRIMMREGLGVDVVSGGELFTAHSVGFPSDKIIFHGNNKTTEELQFAVECGVGRIVVDNLAELERLQKVLEEKDTTVAVQLRIKPGVDAHTHDFVRTGQIDSKFGFALETGEAMEAVKSVLSCPRIQLKGLHCHIGSQIFDITPFVHTAEIMVQFISEIKQQLDFQVEELNLGGGFGIQYTECDTPVPYGEYMQCVSTAIEKACTEYQVKKPYILLEPGRSIVGEAGITLYTVGAEKVIPKIRTYVSVDGGMGDNPRYALYGSKYEAVIANKVTQPRNKQVTIAGKCCESGDLIGENMSLQQAEAGDILAVLATGAYNYSMASNYNRICRPAVVLVNQGMHRIIVKRETFEDLIRNDL